MALPIDVTDPGTQQVPLTNVETQAFGIGLAALVTPTLEDNVLIPASSSPNNLRGDNFKPGLGIAADIADDDVAEQATSATPLLVLRGDSFKPGLGVATDFADDDVAEQSTSAAPLVNLRGDSGGERRFPIADVVDPGTQQVPTINVETQVYGSGGLPARVFV